MKTSSILPVFERLNASVTRESSSTEIPIFDVLLPCRDASRAGESMTVCSSTLLGAASPFSAAATVLLGSS